MKISKSTDDAKFNILVYATPGVGKTYFAGTAVGLKELGEVLFVDLDRGLKSLSHLAGKFSKTEPLSTTKEFEELMFELAGEKGKQYKTVVIDSVSELAAISLSEVLAAAVAKGGRRDNIDQSELLDFKISGAKMLRLLRLARDLPQNVVFTARATKVFPTDASGAALPGSKPMEIFPTMPKRVREELFGMVDCVAYLNLESDGTRKLYTQPLGPILSKNRLANIPSIVDNPHMTVFTNKKDKA